MKPIFKIALMTLPFVAAGVGFVAFTIVTKPAPAQQELVERAVAVRVIEAREMAISPRATGFGLITPARNYEAISQVSGTIEYVNPALNKGEILPAGAVLLRLSDSDYKLAIAQARANIRATEARLAEIGISENNLHLSLEIEEETLALRTIELERFNQLFEAGTASQADLDRIRAAYLAQRQRVQGQNSALALVPAQRQAQIEQMAVHEATLEIAQLNLQRTELRLPFSARVAEASAEIGQLVRSGQTVAKFDGVATAEVEAQITAADLQKLFRQNGSETIRFTFDPAVLTEIMLTSGIESRVLFRLGETYIEWPAKMDRISNAIDPRTGTLGVILRIENAYESALPGARPPLTRGMFVEVVLSATPIDAMVVPRSALRGDQLMVLDDNNRLQLVPVIVDFIQDRTAIISGGLTEGTQVIVSNPVPMVEGMLLKPHLDLELMQEIDRAGIGE